MNHLAASVRARLLNLAKAQGVDFNQVLVRFALERILYRLSQSDARRSFSAQGRAAVHALVRHAAPRHPRRRPARLRRERSGIRGPDLSRHRQPSRWTTVSCSIRPRSPPRKSARTPDIPGRASSSAGELAKARCKTQIDIGFGDAVTPGPVDATYPVLMADLPAPRLRTYPVYTVVAEKLHAIALLGMTNSRMKDYLDLSVLLDRETLDIRHCWPERIKATFKRRGMAVPAELPIGLTDEFANDPSRQALWQAFLKKNELAVMPLTDVVTTLRATLQPALVQVASVVADLDKQDAS